jgi:hypothetical protein
MDKRYEVEPLPDVWTLLNERFGLEFLQATDGPDLDRLLAERFGVKK